MDIYIYQHQGLGDMIANNALIRHLVNLNPKTKKFHLFCKNSHKKSLQFMYRDEKKISILSISNDPKNENRDVSKYLRKLKKKYELIKIGHEFYDPTAKLNPYWDTYPWHCTTNFYKQFGLPLNYRFKNTYWKRDYKREKRLMNKLVGKNKNFIFLQDDPSKGMTIDISKINKNYKIIKNDNNHLIFDYGLILENAKELHLIESSLKQLVETLQIKSKKLYLYKYKGSQIDYTFSLYNKDLKKWIGTTKNWKEIFLIKGKEDKKKSRIFQNFFKSR